MINACCVDALNPAGRPSPDELKAVGFTGARSVFFDHPDWYSYHRSLKQVGLQSIITLARESFGDQPYNEVISNLPTDADMVVIGNEPDGEGDSSWRMSPNTFRTLINECAPPVRARCPEAEVVAGGLVSGQPSWLEPVWSDIAQEVDFFDIHPYNKAPEEARALLNAYYNLTSCPMVVLEWNRPTSQIDAFFYMLHGETYANAWFCWGDRMVSGFGLLNTQGKKKPEYYAVHDALMVAQPPMPPQYEFVEGFKQIADRHPDLVGIPLQNERGPWLNCSVQKTSNGLLLWGDFKDIVGPPLVVVGDQKGFLANDLKLYVWRLDHLEPV